ncbi:MAG: DUF3135 domain-containing protein [Nitrococcus mobilis]|nr:DUF3135 domain-containing protein [Nitrococcus mobilis]
MDSERCFTIDFDEWSSLARHDPQGFEARRRAMLDSFIKAQPVGRRQRLRCLQWRVDRVRQSSSTPLLACQRLSQLMWEAFAGPRGLMQILTGPCPPARDTRQALRSAKILLFRRPDQAGSADRSREPTRSEPEPS